MDFAVPTFVLEAINQRMTHPTLGYTVTPPALEEAFVQWCLDRFNWKVDPDWLVWVHGVVPGLNLAVSSIGNTLDRILVPVPVYPPFFNLAINHQRTLLTSQLIRECNRWVMDTDELSNLATQASCIAICNPQNPTGRIYTETELRELAELCVQTDTVLISDEIHWGLTLNSKTPHTPVASLEPEYAQNTITLISHTKAYNIPGLQVAVAIIPNPEIKARFEEIQSKLFGSISPLSYVAALAAYTDKSPWLEQLNRYLCGNRDLLQEAVESTGNLTMTDVEGTYLGWIDASALPVKDPHAYFEAHGLGLSPGQDFGMEQFVRFNFAAPRTLVEIGIERLLSGANCATSTEPSVETYLPDPP